MNPAQILLRGFVRGYQWFISPILPGTCRYVPTCSEYALDAVRLHGALKGGWMGLTRILRCNPLGSHGYDPVPEPGKAPSSHSGCGCGSAHHHNS